MSNYLNKCIVDKLKSQRCPIDTKFSELKPLEKFELFVEWIKYKWLTYSIIFIFFSLIILFYLGIYVEVTKKGDFDILKNLNTWVGFILGLIATIFSIISMFLSFYNIEKAKESEEKQQNISVKILEDIQSALKETNSIISKQETNIVETLRTNFYSLNEKINNIENKIDTSSSGQDDSMRKFQ
ncbi:MAG: hypothetical protein ACRCZO_02850 [Cetobacterium sp.]